MIYDHSQMRGNTQLTIADSGLMGQTPDKSFLLITLYNGSNYEEITGRDNTEKKPFRRTIFSRQVIKFDLSQFDLTRTNEEYFKSAQYMLNIRQLSYTADSINLEINGKVKELNRTLLSYYYNLELAKLNDSTYNAIAGTGLRSKPQKDTSELQKNRLVSDAVALARNVKGSFEFNRQVINERSTLKARHLIEWHRKFTLSVACLALFLIGAPLGTIIRKGGLGMPLVISVLLFVIYHVISFSGEKAARSGVMEAWEGMWLSTVIFLPVGLFLTYKATTDSSLLNAESYMHLLKRTLPFLFKDRNRDEDSAPVQ
jgi:lipopolysaccharide export system permease protein